MKTYEDRVGDCKVLLMGGATFESDLDQTVMVVRAPLNPEALYKVYGTDEALEAYERYVHDLQDTITRLQAQIYPTPS
jgi:hypothetical protein